MENLVLAFNAVAPTFLIIALGYVLKRIGMLPEALVPKVNNMVFYAMLSVLLFRNVYASESISAVNPGLLVYTACGVLAMYGLVTVVIHTMEKAPKRRGAMIQAIYRGNLVLLGLPIVDALFAGQDRGSISLVIAVVVPMFNVLAVLTLEIYRGGTIHWGKTLRSVLTNPLICGTVAGLIFLLAGWQLPWFLEEAVNDIADAATPMALLLLGASFTFASMQKNRAAVAVCVIGKLIAVPGVFVTGAALLGFRGIDLAIMLAVFAAPTAVSSFTMAQKMDSDYQLAGEAVVMTAACSCVTIFLWVFVLKTLGLL